MNEDGHSPTNNDLPAKPRRGDVVWTREKRADFLIALESTGNVSRASKAVGMSRQGTYNQKEKDSKFAALWEEALANYIDGLEAEVDRRAFEGNDKPVWHRGEKVGSIKEYSDLLAMFRLKGLRPGMYRDNATEVKIGVGINLNE